MIYKVACAVLLLGVLFLGTRLKVAEDRMQTKIEEMSEQGSIKADAEFKLDSMSQQVEDLLNENAALLNSLNECKNQEPQIITRYVKKKPTVNASASEQFIELLSRRYELQWFAHLYPTVPVRADGG